MLGNVVNKGGETVLNMLGNVVYKGGETAINDIFSRNTGELQFSAVERKQRNIVTFRKQTVYHTDHRWCILSNLFIVCAKM